jgi:PPP family 3-phenylpropionic acid transporter
MVKFAYGEVYYSVLSQRLTSIPQVNKSFVPLFSTKYIFFWKLILTGALLQSTHAAYYAFSTIYWIGKGISPFVIGLLWAEGVFFEIVVFSIGDRLIRKCSISNLFALAGLAAAMRWTITGLSSSLFLLAIAQSFHGFSFACVHLTTIVGIKKIFKNEALSSTAYGINMAVTSSVGMGFATLLASIFYGYRPAFSFFAMAAIAVIAIPIAKGLKFR